VGLEGARSRQDPMESARNASADAEYRVCVRGPQTIPCRSTAEGRTGARRKTGSGGRARRAGLQRFPPRCRNRESAPSGRMELARGSPRVSPASKIPAIRREAGAPNGISQRNRPAGRSRKPGSQAHPGSGTRQAPLRGRSFRFQWPADLLPSWGFEMETLTLGSYVLLGTHSALVLTNYAFMPPTGTLAPPMPGRIGRRLWAAQRIFAKPRCPPLPRRRRLGSGRRRGAPYAGRPRRAGFAGGSAPTAPRRRPPPDPRGAVPECRAAPPAPSRRRTRQRQRGAAGGPASRGASSVDSVLHALPACEREGRPVAGVRERSTTRR